MADSYFIKRGEKVLGPFSAGQVKKLAKYGKFLDDDEVSNRQDGPWTPAAKAFKQQQVSSHQESVTPEAETPATKPLETVQTTEEAETPEEAEEMRVGSHSSASSSASSFKSTKNAAVLFTVLAIAIVLAFPLLMHLSGKPVVAAKVELNSAIADGFVDAAGLFASVVTDLEGDKSTFLGVLAGAFLVFALAASNEWHQYIVSTKPRCPSCFKRIHYSATKCPNCADPVHREPPLHSTSDSLLQTLHPRRKVAIGASAFLLIWIYAGVQITSPQAVRWKLVFALESEIRTIKSENSENSEKERKTSGIRLADKTDKWSIDRQTAHIAWNEQCLDLERAQLKVLEQIKYGTPGAAVPANPFIHSSHTVDYLVEHGRENILRSVDDLIDKREELDSLHEAFWKGSTVP